MAEELLSAPPPMQALPRQAPPARQNRGFGAVLFAVLLAFLLGALAVGFAVWKGVVPLPPTRPAKLAVPAAAPSPIPSAGPGPAALAAHQDSLEGRLAALERRLDSLNSKADAASGNAARAEALMVAFAARRALDRGAPLGYLEDQLRLRFGNAQPNAVATVIEAGKSPVTLDQLLAGLDSLAPALTEAPPTEGAWSRLKRELAGLFVIRREAAPSPAPVAILTHARIMLEAGRIEDATAELRRLPGAAGATDWFTAARRFDDAHRALDVLETSAVLDNRGLRDGEGQAVTQPAPTAP